MRWMELEIVDTIEARDVLTTNDCFIGMTDLTSEGIKIKVLEDLEA
jgi:N-methylhydantoinase B/oxoprolinase/acetone carboxylase alpha subunit